MGDIALAFKNYSIPILVWDFGVQQTKEQTNHHSTFYPLFIFTLIVG